MLLDLNRFLRDAALVLLWISADIVSAADYYASPDRTGDTLFLLGGQYDYSAQIEILKAGRPGLTVNRY